MDFCPQRHSIDICICRLSQKWQITLFILLICTYACMHQNLQSMLYSFMSMSLTLKSFQKQNSYIINSI